MNRPTYLALAALALLAPRAHAQQSQQKLPPVRPIGPVIARSDEQMRAVSTAVPLPGGKVLVNDILMRRVILFDSTLKLVTVVADSSSATANAYGARGGGLIGYGGDSALFIDPASLSMMVINANGELTTVRAVPRANEIGLLAGGPNGRPGFDPQGRLVYRGAAQGRRAGGDGARGGGDGQRGGRPGAAGGQGQQGDRAQQRREVMTGPGGMSFQLPEQPDSAPIVRVDMSTRALDTVATFKIPKIDIKVTQNADGRPNIQTTINPMPNIDDWALLSDGTIALVRGHDFHVDWRKPDGSVVAGPKLPFEWQRLSDDDKAMVVDSARAAIEKQRAEAQRMMNQAGGPVQFMQQGGGERIMVMGGGGAPPQRGAAPAGGAAPAAPAGAAPAGPNAAGGGPGGPGGFQIPPINMIAPNELPDYRPPFLQQSSLGDLEGNLWVRTTAPVGEGGPIYYVITRENEVLARVQVPQGRQVAGFGKGGIVFLAFRDAEEKAHLEIARWK